MTFWGHQTKKRNLPLAVVALSLRRWVDIREIRLQRELTQEQAAKKCRIDYKSYQAYEEQEPTDLRLSTIERLVRGLGVSIAELFA